MAKTTREKACAECPFRRRSAAGYLGSATFDPDGFLNPHWHGELKLPCHMEIDWTRDPELVEDMAEEANHCFGYLTFMRNSCKLPHDVTIQALLKTVEKDDVEFFSNRHEFSKHHENKDKTNG